MGMHDKKAHSLCNYFKILMCNIPDNSDKLLPAPSAEQVKWPCVMDQRIGNQL